MRNITEQRLHGAPDVSGRFKLPGAYMAHRCTGLDAGQAKGTFALTRVSARTAVMDYGDKRTLPLAITAREIADDICREINSDAGEHSFMGVFVCAGDAPTEAELKKRARRSWTNFIARWWLRRIASGRRSHSFLFIHDLQRRAAAKLGMEKEWHYQVRETEECPGCGDRVKPGVAVCKSCHAILNRDKALALGLVQAPPAAVDARVERPAAPRRAT